MEAAAEMLYDKEVRQFLYSCKAEHSQGERTDKWWIKALDRDSINYPHLLNVVKSVLS